MKKQKKVLVGVIWIVLFLSFLAINPAEVLSWAPSDVRINGSGENVREPSMVSTPDGVFYVAVPFFSIGTNTIKIYTSTNGGRTWAYWHGFAYAGVVSVLHPSIAYAEKGIDEKFLYVAVEITSASAKSVGVVRLNTVNKETDFFDVNDPIFDTSHDIYPEICTDYLDFLYGHYVYITYAQSAPDYYPVYFSRSTDFGVTWMTPTNITGGSENTSWEARPDIAWGTSNNDLFVVFEKPAWIAVSGKWETRNWVTRSTNYGVHWEAPVSLASAFDDGMEYHPRVSAARGNHSVLVAYTRNYLNSGDLDIGYAYTTDGGTIWSTGWTLASSTSDEDGVELSQSDSQGNFHAAFVRWTFPEQELRYTQRPTDFSSGWTTPVTINEPARASLTYPKPAVCANPTKPDAQEAAIAWTDYRETWYDVFFDSAYLRSPAGFLPAVELLLLE